MALAILWSELEGGERMTLALLSTLTLMKSIKGFLEFYSLSSRCGTLFNVPSSNKNWKDHWFFVDGRWLASGYPFVGHIASRFKENGRYPFSLPPARSLDLDSSVAVFPIRIPPLLSESEGIREKIMTILKGFLHLYLQTKGWPNII